MKRTHQASLSILFVLIASHPVAAQVPQTLPSENSGAAARQSLSLAEHGKCKQALQWLRKAPQFSEKELRIKAGVATIRCAVNLDQTEVTVEAIQLLNREFPHDPEVLYVTTHAYSDLSTRASLELGRSAPNSYQAHEMNAEALEMQGKWDDAAAEYRRILEQNPDLPGIHFRLGRLILSRPETRTMRDDATKEFEAELKNDPNNAGAEYILGEFARQQGQWADAIHHFSNSVKLDPGLTDALLGLGIALMGESKFHEAILPLEAYVKAQPGNPAGHYQLATAYNRVGRKEDAARETARQQETADKIEQDKLQNVPPASSQQQTGPPH